MLTVCKHPTKRSQHIVAFGKFYSVRLIWLKFRYNFLRRRVFFFLQQYLCQQPSIFNQKIGIEIKVVLQVIIYTVSVNLMVLRDMYASYYIPEQIL